MKILVTRPVPTFCDAHGLHIDLNTGEFNEVWDTAAKNIEKKHHGVICKNKCIYCPYPGFFAAKGQDVCDGCLCELRAADGNRKLDEFI